MRLTEAHVLALLPGHALLHPADEAAAALAAPHRVGLEDAAPLALTGETTALPEGTIYLFAANTAVLSAVGGTHPVTLRATAAGAWIVVERCPGGHPDALPQYSAYRASPPLQGAQWLTIACEEEDFADVLAALDPEYAASDRWIVGIVPADEEAAADA